MAPIEPPARDRLRGDLAPKSVSNIQTRKPVPECTDQRAHAGATEQIPGSHGRCGLMA